MLWWTLRKLQAPDWETRAAAAALLGNRKETRSVPALTRLLQDDNTRVRSAAAAALGKIGDGSTAESLAEALSHSRAQQERTPQPKYLPEKPNYGVFARALAALGPAATDALVRRLDSDDREVRRWAVWALGEIADARSLDALCARLEDASSEVRQAAARAVTGIGRAEAVQPVIKALAHKDPETRRTGAEALAVLKGSGSMEALCHALRDSEQSVQLAAIESLKKNGGEAAIAGLRAALGAGRKPVREAAAQALQSMGFRPDNPEERATAAVLAGDFAGAVAVGEAAVPPLIDALGSGEADRRRQAARALAELHDKRAVKSLLRALKDTDAAVREEAVRALVAIGSPAVEGLCSLLPNSRTSRTEVQKIAATALGAIGDVRAARPLADTFVAKNGYWSSLPGDGVVARCAASSLKRLLTTSSELFAEADLEFIARLPDLHRQHQCGDDEQTHRFELDLDCSDLRQLARQELEHRGSSG